MNAYQFITCIFDPVKFSVTNAFAFAFKPFNPLNLIGQGVRFHLEFSNSKKFQILSNSAFQVCGAHSVDPGPEVIKLFSCSTQLSMKFSPPINVKMPTIVGILTCMSGKNNILGLTEP